MLYVVSAETEDQYGSAELPLTVGLDLPSVEAYLSTQAPGDLRWQRCDCHAPREVERWRVSTGDGAYIVSAFCPLPPAAA